MLKKKTCLGNIEMNETKKNGTEKPVNLYISMYVYMKLYSE